MRQILCHQRIMHHITQAASGKCGKDPGKGGLRRQGTYSSESAYPAQVGCRLQNSVQVAGRRMTIERLGHERTGQSLPVKRLATGIPIRVTILGTCRSTTTISRIDTNRFSCSVSGVGKHSFRWGNRFLWARPINNHDIFSVSCMVFSLALFFWI